MHDIISHSSPVNPGTSLIMTPLIHNDLAVDANGDRSMFENEGEAHEMSTLMDRNLMSVAYYGGL
jgi:hypothetical protein